MFRNVYFCLDIYVNILSSANIFKTDWYQGLQLVLGRLKFMRVKIIFNSNLNRPVLFRDNKESI